MSLQSVLINLMSLLNKMINLFSKKRTDLKLLNSIV